MSDDDAMAELALKANRFIAAAENPEPPTTAKTRRIVYTGVYHAPDVFDDLSEERRAAVWKLTHRPEPTQPARTALLNYIEAIDALLRSTSAKATDE